MRILVIGGHGKTGTEVLKEAQARNHEVVALTRRNEAVAAGKQIVKSVFDLNAEDLKSYDAVVNTLGFWTEDTLPLHKKAMQHLCTILAGNQTHYVVVGGAGSLFVNKEHTVKLEETPDFLDSYKAVSKETGEAFEELKKHSNLNWTYISPAADYRADGERTSRYALAGEEFTLNDNGESYLSYADMGQIVLDIIESGKYTRQRLSAYTK